MDAYTLPSISADRYLSNPDRFRLLDVRKGPARIASGVALAAADWRDPERLRLTDPIFRSPAPLAIACVHGHEVSTYITAMALVAGAEAVRIDGGVEALRAAGARTQALAEAPE